MADVHLFSGIRGGVIDDPSLALQGGGGGAEGFGGGVGSEPGFEGGGAEGEVEKAWTCDGDLGEGGEFGGECGDEGLGSGAGVLPGLFGVGEDAVGLEIPVLGGGNAHIGRKEREVEADGASGAF